MLPEKLDDRSTQDLVLEEDPFSDFTDLEY